MAVTKASVRSFARMGQRAAFFAMAMPEIARENQNLKVLTADLAQLSNLDRFARQYPDQFLNLGIAEQNMIGVASGLAMEGYCVFATTYASFLAVRDLEQVRQHVSQLKLNVKLVGTAAGVVAARSGIAHWATEDLAFMRALPNMRVMCAADALEAYYMAHYAATMDGPVYIRLNGVPDCPIVYDEHFAFQPDAIQVLRHGTDIVLLATGLMVHEALDAAVILQKQGISATVADVHTIKPLDYGTLKQMFHEHRLVVTLEEHSVIGGLGGAVAEYKAGLENTPRQLMIGIPDQFTEDTGSQRYLWEKFGMTASQIVERIQASLMWKG